METMNQSSNLITKLANQMDAFIKLALNIHPSKFFSG
jgi:hypothetical protein